MGRQGKVRWTVNFGGVPNSGQQFLESIAPMKRWRHCQTAFFYRASLDVYGNNLPKSMSFRSEGSEAFCHSV